MNICRSVALLSAAWVFLSSALSAQEDFIAVGGPVLPGTGNSLTPTSDGGYVVAGGDEDMSSSVALRLLKFAPTGEALWLRSYEGRRRVCGVSVCETSDGGLAVIAVNDWKYPSPVLIKLGAEGDILWNRTIGDGYFLMPRSLHEMPNGDLLLGGGSSNLPSYTWIVHVLSSGRTKRSWVVDSPDGDFTSVAVRPASDGGFWLAGGIEDSTGTIHGNITRLNRRGVVVWSRTYGSGGMSMGIDLVEAPDGGCVLVGVSGARSGSDETGRPGGRSLGSLERKSVGTDVFRFGRDGELIWGKRLVAFDRAAAMWDIALNPEGTLLLAGTVGNVGGRPENPRAEGSICTLVLDREGDPREAWTYGESDHHGGVHDLHVLPEGGAVIAGYMIENTTRVGAGSCMLLALGRNSDAGCRSDAAIKVEPKKPEFFDFAVRSKADPFIGAQPDDITEPEVKVRPVEPVGQFLCGGSRVEER